tara:strand:+ start:6726 stop:7724 length:999 start_codon:yes stop_codon:yes gene_type:complete
MLEQAIIDAQTLREAAIKNAETAVVEKYSDEVREAVSNLLEQEDDLGLDLGLEDTDTAETPAEASPETEEVVDQAPAAHLAEDETVVIDLDDIGATLEKELASGEASEDDGVSRDEMMDSLELDTEEEPANRPDQELEEELDLDEGELVDLFKEILAVDVPQGDIDMALEEAPEEELTQDELQETPPTDGMNKEDVEELQAELEKENDELKEQVAKLTETLNVAKETFEKLNLHNARLLYANRVLSDSSLNEQQKSKIAEMVDKARSVEEAKLVFETLQKTMATTKKVAPQSLSEAVSKSSSVILGGNRRDESTTESNPTTNRWATLAGLNK